jgi:F-type H+-transporting ATPase subunit gamma
MGSLKEVRGRIASVTSTSKVTSAMRMVSAAKLRHAETAIAGYLPYEQKLTNILEDFLAFSADDLSIPLAQKRDIKRVAIVTISSNGSLCGAFNSNIIRKTEEVVAEYSVVLPSKDILIYPLGKKVAEAFIKRGIKPQGDYIALVEKPNYDGIAELADNLMNLFLTKQIDAVELVYNHFKNAAVQTMTRVQVLPMQPVTKSMTSSIIADYIIEPNSTWIVQKIMPKVVRLKLYSALLDSSAAEYGARTTAMQTATDNAEDMIQDLKLKYNKARQESITKEIIDIVGGAESLR